MRGCKCLNTIIETNESELQSVDTLDLQKEESEDIFFKLDLKQAKNLNNINRIIPDLDETREVGSWIIHYCINCKFHTHAVHKEKGASCVLINGAMLDKDSINKCRQNENFSQVLGIVIDSSDYVEEKDNEDAFYNPEMEATAKYVKKNFFKVDVLEKEASMVKERIEKFTVEETLKLQNLYDKSYNEAEALIRILVSHSSKKVSSNKNELCDNKKLPDEIVYIPTNLKNTQKRPKSSPKLQNGNLDSEVLFQFDGIDDESVPFNNEDSESEEETIGRIARNRSNSPGRKLKCKMIVKSLPMDIPVFPKNFKDLDSDNEDEDLPLEDNIDIAASIKKLAKSVHGSTVFGDLPRPRFSTQL